MSQIVPLQGRDFNLRDPDDNKVLETAVVGKCNYLITGDKDLLTLGGYNRIQIVAPAEFLSQIR
ncbi:putative toxin-antitoxin system toxin component, PIN family [Candidatus Curtissbacteria bacterium]|nr:putative toxin-antitoxin system toxin component, PIN family [Candidatus Curtissbacteria bacterium]